MAHSTRETVFILHHLHEKNSGEQDIKLIGIYSSRSKAEEAILMLSIRTGFRDMKEGFEITEYEIDQDHWREAL